MNLRHPSIEIPEDNPFLNCKLERKKYADILMEVVNSGDGFVLAINNEWGTGKTTFIQMWRQLLVNENFRTIYFNAWENDFETTPLPAILAELKNILTPKNEIKFNSVLKAGAKVAQNVVPAIAKGIMKRYVDINELTEGVEGVAKAATEILNDEIKKYTSRQKGMLEFRKNLEDFILNGESDKPLIFIIDELDRCRPSYAVEFLEHIKHFFSVRGIVFILAIDKKQLCNSINGAYGSENFDSSDYLRRFIDIEYSIPSPITSTFCEYLFEHYGFGDFFDNPVRLRHPKLKADGDDFIRFSSLLFDGVSLTLRQQEKVYAHARVALKSFKENSYTFPAAFIFLIYISKFNSSLFLKIKDRQISIQEFINEIELILKTLNTQTFLKFVLHTEAVLIYLYGNYYSDSHKDYELIIIKPNTQERRINISSTLDQSNEFSVLKNILLAFESTDFYNIKMDYLLNKVDLLDKLN